MSPPPPAPPIPAAPLPPIPALPPLPLAVVGPLVRAPLAEHAAMPPATHKLAATSPTADLDFLFMRRSSTSARRMGGTQSYRIGPLHVAPIIESLERQRRDDGAYPGSMTRVDGWAYTPTRDGYVLSSKLGWDPEPTVLVAPALLPGAPEEPSPVTAPQPTAARPARSRTDTDARIAMGA